MDISISSEDWSAYPDMGSFLTRAACTAVEVASLPAGAGAELSIVLGSDEFVRQLNRTYLGRDSATNVLSFPQEAPTDGAQRALIGDIALAFETVAREAAADKKPIEHHAAHLVIHGLLHLFGYDHETDRKATRMEDMERAVLGALGIPDPYIQDEEQSEPAVLGPAS